jgi:hypothetical protein
LFSLSVAAVVALIFFGVFNWVHRARPEAQFRVHGQLLEWSQIRLGRNRGTTLRFTITGYKNDFRIDPALFRDLMKGRMPTDFVRGAQVEAMVDRAQLASPDRPPLDPGLRIVWVNGLAINGSPSFSVSDTVKHDARDGLLWWLLMAGALALCGCLWLDRRRRTSRLRRG